MRGDLNQGLLYCSDSLLAYMSSSILTNVTNLAKKLFEISGVSAVPDEGLCAQLTYLVSFH